MDLELIHLNKLNDYSESLTEPKEEESIEVECNDCGHRFETYDSDVYKCGRCGSNDLLME
jgi:Zn finger protein HypA/HybF involved in hydrogenase expression